MHALSRHLSHAMGNVIHITYDYDFSYLGQAVLRKIQTDPLGNQQIKIYNTHHAVVCEMCLNRFGETTQSESYIYDTCGRKVESEVTVYFLQEPPRKVRTLREYDSMGNMVHCIEANTSSDQKHTRYYFD